MTTVPRGYRHEAFTDLGSTSDAVLARLVAGDPGNLWITAERQSAGRGRRGKAWSTDPGNLAASLGLVDPAPPERAATLSFVAAVALHRALADVCGPRIEGRLELKWPNDVLLDRRKIAGILIEGQTLPGGRLGVVVGIGVNCASHPGLEGPFPSESLAGVGFRATAEDLFAALAVSLAAECARWARGEGFPAIRQAWLARAGGLGEPVTVSLADREKRGIFRDIDEAGRLVLERADGHTDRITAGEVFLRQRVEG